MTTRFFLPMFYDIFNFLLRSPADHFQRSEKSAEFKQVLTGYFLLTTHHLDTLPVTINIRSCPYGFFGIMLQIISLHKFRLRQNWSFVLPIFKSSFFCRRQFTGLYFCCSNALRKKYNGVTKRKVESETQFTNNSQKQQHKFRVSASITFSIMLG